jgi:diacylglycerol kinase family enzyme
VMDDGKLTYMIMQSINRLLMIYFLPILMNANHLKYKRYFAEATAQRLRIEADRTMAIHADGEIFGSWEANVRQVEVSIIPAAIRVLCG